MNSKTLKVFLFCLMIFNSNQFKAQPRIFLSQQRIEELKASIEIPGSHHYELFEQIKHRINQNDLDNYGEGKTNYLRAHCAVENALGYLLTNDTTYSNQAFQQLLAMYESPETGTPTIPDLGSYETHTPGSKALTYAFPGMAYGICYDWLKEVWTPSQTQTVYDSLIEGLNDWEKLFRWELYNMPSSNWVSVCRGTELIMMLAAREEEKRAARYDTIKYLLRLHYDLAYGSGGYTNEGISYLNYGVPFSYAAKLAARDVGDNSLDESFARPFHELFMYSFVSTDKRLHSQTSVDGHYPPGEGIFGLMFDDLSGEPLQYYKYFYDHYCGVNSGIPDDEKYDQSRLGAVWNMIYYPEDVEGKSPDVAYDAVYADEEFGAFFFRNHWQSENSILFHMMSKAHKENKGWQDAETFNFGLIAFGNRFFGGPGKAHETEDYSSLLVDGQSRSSSKHTGGVDYFKKSDNGGYLIIDGGEKYRALGLTSAKRHTYVEYPNDSMAVIFMLDQLASSTPHTYSWQGNVGNEEGNAGISTSVLSEESRNGFLLSGQNKGFVKGYILNQENKKFQGLDPVYLDVTDATDTTIWVMLIVGKGTPPSIEFSGKGLDTEVLMGDSLYYFDPAANRIKKKARQLSSLPSSTSNNQFFFIQTQPETSCMSVITQD